MREILSEHGVSFAMVFGSLAKDDVHTDSDLDLAVSFEALGPEDEGYSDAYLRLRSAVGDAISYDIDIVDVRTMPESFAETVFEHGVTIRGSEDQRAELKAEFAGEELSTEAAKDRVAAAVERLRNDGEVDSGNA
ncbi:type VII toxin-antitoxin system MntA family adenylyltransferase antitoxin [Halosimplex halobium]|uniref:type VII toxin-antitoxin system MntA family adenylyltransferase antitoxin n=1 Tax=Halosimplex halobium TaxID=3396618 RepID=UPI003F546E88